jgi:D-sedoheptulose 7-phosphate isomerase
MKDSVKFQVDLLIDRYPALEVCKESIINAFYVLKECFSSGHKLLIVGNGGSCSDAEHIAGELMKSFKMPRKCSNEMISRLRAIDQKRGAELGEALQKGLPTLVLSNHQSLNTAFINDVPNGGLLFYAQQVYGYGNEGDVLLAISTSGNSDNILNATVVAKANGLKVVGLTGHDGGELARFADVAIKAPQKETFMVQELHLPIYHCLCLMLENHFFNIN